MLVLLVACVGLDFGAPVPLEERVTILEAKVAALEAKVAQCCCATPQAAKAVPAAPVQFQTVCSNGQCFQVPMQAADGAPAFSSCANGQCSGGSCANGNCGGGRRGLFRRR